MLGIVFPNKVLGESCGDFLVDFSGLFPWKKQEEKSTPKNPRQNPNQNLGASRPKSTLQGSSVEFLILQVFLIGGLQEGGFQKGAFSGCSPVPKTGTRVHSEVPRHQNRNEGTVICGCPQHQKPEPALSLNHPLVSSSI